LKINILIFFLIDDIISYWGRSDEVSCRTKVFFKLTITLAILFILILMLFLSFGKVSNDSEISNIVNNLVANIKYIFFTILIIVSIFSIYSLFNNSSMKDKFVKKDKHIFLIMIILSGIYILIQSVILPFSPSHDANTIYKAIINNGILDGDTEKYFNFYAINKLVMYIYLAFAKLIGDVILSMKVFGFLSIYITCILTTMTVKNLFVKSNKYITLFLATIFIPYGFITMPYVYQITIPLLILAIYLYSLNNKYLNILSVVVSGIIFVFRPTTLIPILSLILFIAIFEMFNRKKYYKRLIHLLLIILLRIFFKFIIGQLMYSNKLHPYPNLSNPTLMWSMYVGTSYDKNNQSATGKWKNNPNVYLESDLVSQEISGIWDNIGKVNYTEYLNDKKMTEIMIMYTFEKKLMSNPGEFIPYISNKFSNLYGDAISLYLYNPIINNNNLMGELKNNYQKQFNLLHNTFIYIFCISSMIILIRGLKNNIKDKDIYINLSLILSVIFCTVIYVIALEVTKRYTFDFYIPMLIVSAYGMSIITQQVINNSNINKICNSKIINISVVIVSVLCIYIILNSNKIMCFDRAEYNITDGINNEHFLNIFLKDMQNNETLTFYNSNNEIYLIEPNKLYSIPYYCNESGGVALIVIYNQTQYIQIKQYDNNLISQYLNSL